MIPSGIIFSRAREQSTRSSSSSRQGVKIISQPTATSPTGHSRRFSFSRARLHETVIRISLQNPDYESDRSTDRSSYTRWRRGKQVRFSPRPPCAISFAPFTRRRHRRCRAVSLLSRLEASFCPSSVFCSVSLSEAAAIRASYPPPARDSLAAALFDIVIMRGTRVHD